MTLQRAPLTQCRGLCGMTLTCRRSNNQEGWIANNTKPAVYLWNGPNKAKQPQNPPSCSTPPPFLIHPCKWAAYNTAISHVSSHPRLMGLDKLSTKKTLLCIMVSFCVETFCWQCLCGVWPPNQLLTRPLKPIIQRESKKEKTEPLLIPWQNSITFQTATINSRQGGYPEYL